MHEEKVCIKERFRQDRESTFRALYEKAFPTVARFIARKGGDLALAEDVFQDAMILYFEKVIANKIQEPHSPQAYLLGIAKNLFYQHCKKKEPNLDLDSLGEAALSFQPAPTTPLADRNRLLDYLSAAGRKCLDLLQAFYYFKTPMKEIATEFGYRSERSATVQKYKCLEKVRASVKQENYAEIIA